MDPGELRIRIDGQAALTISVESSRADEITLDEHWNALCVAWDKPPDRLRVELWLDACLPENGNRELYGARAGIELIEHKLRAGAWEPAALVWANPDAEYPGAVTFESVCTTARTPRYRALGDAEIGERLYEAWRIANNAHKSRPAEYPDRRTSLSGMRGKIGLAWRDGRWCAAAGTALSDWIAKREDSARLRGEAGIESLCQEAMGLLGVEAARTLSRMFGDQQCVLSQRADRASDPITGITAIHQEDFAQATAWPAGQKYDAGTKNEPRWEAACALLRAHGTDPEVETAKLTRILAATWMLGHCDLHRRNLGFTHVYADTGARIRLAPMYDVSSAIGTYLDRRLAIGIARPQNLAHIGTRQWLAHARQCDLDPDRTLEIVREAVRDAPEAIAAARETVRGRDENRYQDSVDRRAEELIHYACTRRGVFQEEEARRFTKPANKGETPPARNRAMGQTTRGGAERGDCVRVRRAEGPVPTYRERNTPGVGERAIGALRASIREMERAPGSGISMCHRQGKTAVFLADDGTSIVEHAPEGTREETTPASGATSNGETACEGARELIVIVGANGAGKTTWGRAHRSCLPLPFYNVDVIAEGLGDANSRELQREARAVVDERIEAHLRAGHSFGFESTYSGRSRPAIVKRAKSGGYTTRALFMGTSTHRLNAARVRRRAREGGHDVPVSEIVRRWTAAWQNLLKTWDVLDTVEIVDNSGTSPRLVASKRSTEIQLCGALPAWAAALAAHARA